MTKPTPKRRTRSDKFPLTVHQAGRFCKKIKGQMYDFGTDRRQALARSLEQAGRRAESLALAQAFASTLRP